MSLGTIIVTVDNASIDSSLEILKEKYPSKIKLIENKPTLVLPEGVIWH